MKATVPQVMKPGKPAKPFLIQMTAAMSKKNPGILNARLVMRTDLPVVTGNAPLDEAMAKAQGKPARLVPIVQFELGSMN